MLFEERVHLLAQFQIFFVLFEFGAFRFVVRLPFFQDFNRHFVPVDFSVFLDQRSQLGIRALHIFASFFGVKKHFVKIGVTQRTHISHQTVFRSFGTVVRQTQIVNHAELCAGYVSLPVDDCFLFFDLFKDAGNCSTHVVVFRNVAAGNNQTDCLIEYFQHFKTFRKLSRLIAPQSQLAQKTSFIRKLSCFVHGDQALNRGFRGTWIYGSQRNVHDLILCYLRFFKT